MPIEVSWYLEKRVIYARCWGTISEADIINCAEQMQALMMQGEAPIHSIFDLTGVEKPFLDLGMIRQSFGFVNDPRYGWSVFYGVNYLLIFLTTTVGQLLGMRYRMVADLEASIAYLKKQDATLNFEGLKAPHTP